MNDRKTANAEATRRLTAARPAFVGVKAAHEVVPGLDSHTLLHAGPPLDEAPPQLLRRALATALLFERRATDLAEAEGRITEYDLVSCNDRRTVAPLAGVVAPATPVVVVRDLETGAEAYSPLSEGGGCALRFGCARPKAIARVRTLAEGLAPLLDRLLTRSGGIDLYPLVATALHMGDDCHHRFKALQLSLALTLSRLSDELELTAPDRRAIVAAVADNDFFPLNLVLAASKAASLAAEGIAGSSVVTTIARNGIRAGLQISGLPGRWFTAPLEPGRLVALNPNSETVPHPDVGDSYVVEANGLGACALAGAPTLARWFGGSSDALVAITTEMYRVTVAEHPVFTIPALGFRGTPVGIDAGLAAGLGVVPVTETLQVAADRHPHAVAIGLSPVPLTALRDAVRALDVETAARPAQESPANLALDDWGG
jgi:hypothetical protein